MMMKRYMMILMTLAGMASMTHAQGVDGVKVSRQGMQRSGDYMAVNMDLDLATLDVASNRAVLLTPMMVNGDRQVELPSVRVYGRNRYYYYVRNGESMLTGRTELSYRASKKPAQVSLEEVVPYQEWMDGSQLVLRRQDYGCCGSILAEQTQDFAGYSEPVVYVPVFAYVRPQAENVKSRSLSGSAYIDFQVNKTDIRPVDRNNQWELNKIQGTINGNNKVVYGLYINDPAPHNGRVSGAGLFPRRLDAALRQSVCQDMTLPVYCTIPLQK